MRKMTRKTARLGDLVAAAFDEAARFTADPREISRLAAEVVRRLVLRGRRHAVAPVHAFA